MESGGYSPRLVIDERLWIIIQFITCFAGEEVKGPISVINSDDVHPEDYTDEMNTGKIIRVKTETGLKTARILVSESDRAYLESIVGQYQKEPNNEQPLRRTCRKIVPKIKQDELFGASESDGDFEPSGSEFDPDAASDKGSDEENDPRIQKRSITHTTLRIVERFDNKKLRQSLDKPSTSSPKSSSRTKSISAQPQNCKMTFDQRTQTDGDYDQHLNDAMEFQKRLRIQMEDLFKTIQAIKSITSNVQPVEKKLEEFQRAYRDAMLSRSLNSNSELSQMNEFISGITLKETSTPITSRTSKSSSSGSKVQTTLTQESSDSEDSEDSDSAKTRNFEKMIPIGTGRTCVSEVVYNQVRWNNYSTATRKLLMGVFPRKVLASHSLTGKPSPAFTNKIPKMKLDSVKVADIIMTVTQNCRVPANLVRTVITTKCSDEHKMYKIRKNNRSKAQKQRSAS